MNAALATASLPHLLEGLAEASDLSVTGVELDSRRIVPGALFLAAQGVGGHGLDHVEEALRRGAAAVAWETVPDRPAPALPVPAIAVPQLARHAGEIAARFWKHPSRSLFTVGVTGTDGKTSTAHLVAQALDRLDRPCAYFGTIGYGRLGQLQEASHTTPDAVRVQQQLAGMRDAGAAACAMEVSSHALDQARVGGVEFDAAILTNVGRDHLDYHGTLDAYAAAKRRLFDWPRLGAAILNRDDARGAAWAQELEGSDRAFVYGLGGPAPPQGRYVLGDDLQLDGTGLRLTVRSHAGAAVLHSRLLGRFNACNLLAALAALLHAEIPLAPAVAALAQSNTVPGRVEGFRAANDRGPLVVVDYAHTPQALAAVLEALRAHCAGRLICVFGCGGDRDRGKRPLMGAAAAHAADALIVTDDNPRSETPQSIVDDILAGIDTGSRGRLRVERDRARAIAEAVRAAGAEDVVLVAGKGHEDYQIYGRERRSFSDRACVADLLGLEPRA